MGTAMQRVVPEGVQRVCDLTADRAGPCKCVAQSMERKTPTVGLEPTTTRLRALRSTD